MNIKIKNVYEKIDDNVYAIKFYAMQKEIDNLESVNENLMEERNYYKIILEELIKYIKLYSAENHTIVNCMKYSRDSMLDAGGRYSACDKILEKYKELEDKIK